MLGRRLLLSLLAASLPLPALGQRAGGPVVEGGTRGREIDPGELWTAMRGGSAAAVMRHATAPGVGDPDGFRLDDCSTQRNLSDEGRTQARAIGRLFRDNGIAQATVLTSGWWRCRETAQLLGLGEVRHEPALDSFFTKREDGPIRTAALRALLAGWTGGPLVCVTHQVNITGLTSVFPASGEIVAVETRGDPDGVPGVSPRVLGRLRA